MNPLINLYVAVVIGFGALALTTVAPADIPSLTLAATWVAAMAVVSLFKLRLPLQRGHATMSMAYVIDFVVLATAGADLAVVVAASGVLVQCLVRVRHTQPWYRTAFSVATVILAVKAAALVWSGLGGTIAQPGLTTTAIPLAFAAVAYFAVNTGLVLAAIALSHGAGSRVAAYFVRMAPAFLVAAGAAIVMQILVSREAYLFLPGAITPVFVCYFAYAAWFRRIADSEDGVATALT